MNFAVKSSGVFFVRPKTSAEGAAPPTSSPDLRYRWSRRGHAPEVFFGRIVGDPNNKKGRALEDAVAAIEGTILQTDPGLAGRTMRIEQRKRVIVDGVRHELDLWVELLGPRGYDALFVFECKNWEEKVSKNDVIILSEKIDAVQAQRGYLVAREFTADARAQAAKDPRVRLLEVRQEEYERLRAPLSFHVVAIDKWDVEVKFTVAGPKTFSERVDFERSEAVIDGAKTILMSYLDPWRAKLVEESVGRFPTISSPAGTYTTEGRDTRDFPPGAFIIDGHEVSAATLKVVPTFRVMWPAIVSSVEVVGRGRVLHFEPVILGGGEMRAIAIGLAQELDPDDRSP